jgi:hypothetical protein
LASHAMWSGCLSPHVTLTPNNEASYRPGLFRFICSSCVGDTIFFKGELVYPRNRLGPPPTDGMPDDVLTDYQEARVIAEASPRAAAALLRLAVQKLCKHLGEKGENINQDIGNLVRKGLGVEIQQALDIVRVVGNNAVHPGEISLDDTPELCLMMFELLNMIVQRLIVEPQKLTQLYSALPDSSLRAIERRDKPT